MTEPLSPHEEELLRAYSRTLADSYSRWKEEGEALPMPVARLLRQWRASGCPLREGVDAAVEESAARPLKYRAADDAPPEQDGCEQDIVEPPLVEEQGRAATADASVTRTAPSPVTGTVTTYVDPAPAKEKKSGATGATRTAKKAAPAAASVSSMPSGASGSGGSSGSTGPSGLSCPSGQLPPGLPGKPSPLLRETPARSPRPASAQGTLDQSPSAPVAAPAPQATEAGAQGRLPGISVPRTPGETAPMSNYLARTSLFAPIRKGRRVMHDKQMLHSPEGISVLYTGKQLDMADQDVYLTALRLAGGIKAGDRIVINRAAFLRMLGYKHNPGARDYKWLEESFYRISTGRVIIKAKHIEANLPLMGALLSDTRSGDYYFTIPRETYALWAKNLYSYIDLEKRHALERNVPLSKWLQSYAQSHAPGVHTISVDLLHQWCGYGGRLRDFRDSLNGALDELTRVGILASWSIQERGKGRQKKIMVSWVRDRTHRDDTPTPALQNE